MAQEHQIKELTRRIQAVLTTDLLKPGWAEKAEESGNPLTGHCYAAVQALYHALGGKEAGWTPKTLNPDTFPEGLFYEADGSKGTHWFIQHQDGTIADPTAGQFAGMEIPYEKGRGAGFLTREPDKRAAEILSRIGHAPQGKAVAHVSAKAHETAQVR